MSISDYTMIAESIHTPSLALLKCVVRRAVTISLSILAVFFELRLSRTMGIKHVFLGAGLSRVLRWFFLYFFIFCLFFSVSSHLIYSYSRVSSAHFQMSREIYGTERKKQNNTHAHTLIKKFKEQTMVRNWKVRRERRTHQEVHTTWIPFMNSLTKNITNKN